MTDIQETAGPLAGIRIVDLTSVISGPGAIGILADQGADVIKIEPASGDIMRSRGPNPGFTPGFVSCNRGKRSVVLDLKQPEAADILWRLIDTADVVAQNFRPGVIDRLGFGADAALKRKPSLVYMSISGVGDSGPYAGKRVYDPVVQALSGVADIQADPESGRPRMIRTLVGDKTTAIYAAQAITAALLARARTGKGQHVQLSMLDTLVSYIWPEGMTAHSIVGKEDHNARPTPHDMIFPTADGYITLGAVSDKEWQALCRVIQREDLIADPRFVTAADRNKNRQERMEVVEQALGSFDTASVLNALEDGDVPCAPVLSRMEMLEDAQVQHNRLVQIIDQPGLGALRQARPAARFGDGQPAPIPTAPALGEHTDEVLAELGLDNNTISSLRDRRIVA